MTAPVGESLPRHTWADTAFVGGFGLGVVGLVGEGLAYGDNPSHPTGAHAYAAKFLSEVYLTPPQFIGHLALFFLMAGCAGALIVRRLARPKAPRLSR